MDITKPPEALPLIEAVIRKFFEALASNDKSSLGLILTQGFYAFDAGWIFRGTELSDFIRTQRESGETVTWSLQPMKIEIDGSMAWATWENKGQVGKSGNLKDVTWLESAVLQKSNMNWQLAFLHSSRAIGR